MALISNAITVQVNPQVPVVPAWYSSMVHKEWKTPISNWLGATGVKDPHIPKTGAQNRIYDAYNGMGADSSRFTLFVADNGGHQDYDGNEVYICNLNTTTPAWQRVWNSTTDHPGSAPGTNYTKWPDGRPSSNHTMSYQIAAEGRWFLPACASRNYEGSADWSQWWEIDVNNTGQSISGQQYDWIDRGGDHPNTAGSVYSGMAAFDPVDRHLITIQLGSPATIYYTPIDTISGAPQYSAPNGGNWQDYGQLTLDTTNRVLLLRGGTGGGGTQYWAWKINTVGGKTGSPHFVGTASGTAPHVGSALHWHPPSNAFITVNTASSQNIYKLTPTLSGGNYTSLTWSTVSSGFSGPVPQFQDTNSGAQIQNKVQLMQAPDGTYALCWWSRFANPDVYICRLTGAI